MRSVYNSVVKVREIERTSWTKLQLSGYSLAVEEGRWNRRGRGRLPLEERLCGEVQTERHVFEQCPESLSCVCSMA